MNESTELCHIVCADGDVYTVHAALRGRLVERNDRLTSNAQLAVDKVTLLVVIAETDEDLIKRLNERKNNVKNRGIRVNMNKTKVMISGERSQCRRLQDGRVVYVAEVLVVIQYDVLVVTSGYTRSVVV